MRKESYIWTFFATVINLKKHILLPIIITITLFQEETIFDKTTSIYHMFLNIESIKTDNTDWITNLFSVHTCPCIYKIL